MSGFISYEPFYFEVERFLNNRSLSKLSGSERNNWAQGPVRSIKPRMDLHEDTDKNLVTASFEFPGVSKDDVQLNFQDGKLTVSAETKKHDERADAGYTFRERLHGKFSRTLLLPQGVKDEQIKATMENGLLTVTFPKALPEPAPSRIVISSL